MEKTRKDWHIASKQHEWKSARLQAKKEYQRKCEEIRTNQQDQEAVIRRKCDGDIRDLRMQADRLCEDQELIYMKKLSDIAAEQDAYMDEFRNYVANLDEADRLAFVSQQKEGGAR